MKSDCFHCRSALCKLRYILSCPFSVLEVCAASFPSFCLDLAVSIPSKTGQLVKRTCRVSKAPQNFTFAYLTSNIREKTGFIDAISSWNSRAGSFVRCIVLSRQRFCLFSLCFGARMLTAISPLTSKTVGTSHCSDMAWLYTLA